MFAIVIGILALVRTFEWTQGAPGLTSTSNVPVTSGVEPSLWDLGTFFFKVGAFTFGGGLSMLAFMQEQVVTQLGWLTPQEFVDGLALGQPTPGRS